MNRNSNSLLGTAFDVAAAGRLGAAPVDTVIVGRSSDGDLLVSAVSIGVDCWMTTGDTNTATLDDLFTLAPVWTVVFVPSI